MIRRLSQTAEAVHVKKGTDELYLGIGTNISLFQGGDERLQYVWQSKEFGLTSPAAINSARVLSKDFSKGLSREEIDAIKAERVAIQLINKKAIAARKVLSRAQGYGGAVSQDTLCGAGYFDVPGLSNTQQPKGFAIASGIELALPDQPEEHIATIAIFADGELVDETTLFTECVYRVNYHDRARRWQYRITSDVDIQQFDMSGSGSELHDGS